MIRLSVMAALGALLASLAALPALAQESPPETAAQPAEQQPARPPARPRLVRHPAPDRPLVPQIESVSLLPSANASTAHSQPSGEPAPVPNRDIEAPRHYVAPQTRLMPDVFRSRMPGRGMTVEGATTETEERVYKPAPGARLTVPFTSR